MVSISGIYPALWVIFCSRRRPWFLQFRTMLGQCTTTEEIETLLKGKVRRWDTLEDCSVSRGGAEGGEAMDEDVNIQAEGRESTVFVHGGYV